MPGRIEYTDEACAIATCGNVFMTVHRKASTMTQMREIRRCLGAFWKIVTPGGGLSIIEPTSLALADKAVRSEMASLARDYVSRCSAIVVEGSGFAAAAGRAMISGMYLVSRPPYPYKITGSVQEAAEWVAPLASQVSDEPIVVRELVETVEAARRAIKGG